MGRPYNRELEALSDTYAWAMRLPIDELQIAIGDLRSAPLLVVGSGGSLAAASFVASVHEACTGQMSRAATPLDASNLQSARQLHVMFLSAGGRNADVRGAFEAVVKLEPLSVVVMCFAPGSPLARQARRSSRTHVFETELPHGKDGFLSVNSLLAFAVLCMRAYAPAGAMPDDLQALESGYADRHLPFEEMRPQLDALWRKKYILLIHGADLHPAAVDMESKFSEAALGALQVADLRNFAHGRHHWLAKRGNDTAVILLTSDRDANVAKRTARLLPKEVLSVVVKVPGEGLVASLRALLWVFHFASFAGGVLGIDPGRPGVPDFGGRIYSLNIWRSQLQRTDIKRIAVDRKLAACCLPPLSDLRSRWEQGFEGFVNRLQKTRFQAIVCDFDGTLVDSSQRFGLIAEDLADKLNWILAAGIPIGIATGRGESVRKVLQTAVKPELQRGVYVGYHNCSDIVRLDIAPSKNTDGLLSHSLTTALENLRNSEVICDVCTIHPNANQIGLRARNGIGVDLVHKLARDVLSPLIGRDVYCFVSTHSVDIVPTDTTKTCLNRHLERLGFQQQLVIGDMGEWPGNDYALLAEPFSISSDRVSTSVSTCWNLAPVGHANSSATKLYLDAIRLDGPGFRFAGLKEGGWECRLT